MLLRDVPAAGVVAASGGNHGVAVAYAAQDGSAARARIFVPSVAVAGQDPPDPRVRRGRSSSPASGTPTRWRRARRGPRSSGALQIHAFDQARRCSARARSASSSKSRRRISTRCSSRSVAADCSAGSPRGTPAVIRLIGVEPEAGADAHRGARRRASRRRSGRRHRRRLARAEARGRADVPDRATSRGSRRAGHRRRDSGRAARRCGIALRIVTEPGGAAAFAALLSARYQPAAGERVGVLVCGGNTTIDRGGVAPIRRRAPANFDSRLARARRRRRALPALSRTASASVGSLPAGTALAGLEAFDVPLQDGPMSAEQVVEELDRIGSPATMAIAGPRFFGFVNSSALPAALAANWLSTAWEQHGGFFVSSPGSTTLEQIALRWTIELLGLPPAATGAFVTGTTVAHVDVARRRAVTRFSLESGGTSTPMACSVRRRSRSSSGAEAHSTLFKALGIVGLGRKRVVTVPVDSQGRMRAGRASGHFRSDHRLRAGRQREHRRVRSLRGDHRARARVERRRGFTSTARSVCGPASRRRGRTSRTGSSSPIPGRPTRTSG